MLPLKNWVNHDNISFCASIRFSVVDIKIDNASDMKGLLERLK